MTPCFRFSIVYLVLEKVLEGKYRIFVYLRKRDRIFKINCLLPDLSFSWEKPSDWVSRFCWEILTTFLGLVVKWTFQMCNVPKQQLIVTTLPCCQPCTSLETGSKVVTWPSWLLSCYSVIPASNSFDNFSQF